MATTTKNSMINDAAAHPLLDKKCIRNDGVICFRLICCRLICSLFYIKKLQHNDYWWKLDLAEGGLGCLPSGSVGDGADFATGINHSGPRLQQQLVEGSLPEELLKLLVTHFFQGLHTAVVQRIGASAVRSMT